MYREIEINFVVGGNSAAFATTGWSAPEAHGCWTSGPAAVLRIPDLDPDLSYRCEVTLGPFVCGNAVLRQELLVSVSGYQLFHDWIATGRTIEFDIPVEFVQLAPALEIKFEIPTAISPKDLLASADCRQLGFGFWRVVLKPHTMAQHISLEGVPVKLAPAPKIAAVTMVYNERDYLPRWLNHYSCQVGIENCYVIDHGSDDGSTENLGRCSVVRIPRSPYDPHKQSEFNSTFCNSLLSWYDWVVYSDVDEILLPDPRVAPTLREYCRRPLPEVVTAIGLNVIHLPEAEAEIDPALPVTRQRNYVFACSSMCKPLLIRRAIHWSPGSHSADADLFFNHLYMFHLRWYDLPYGLRRLQRTRSMPWARTDAGSHQRVEDEGLVRSFEGFAALPKLDGFEFDPNGEPIKSFLEKVRRSTKNRQGDTYRIDLDIWPEAIWRLPERFLGTF